MYFDITAGRADEIILSFLKSNGFEEDAQILRYFDSEGNYLLDSYGTPITDIVDTFSYQGSPQKRVTRISNYCRLLKEVLNLNGNPVEYIDARSRGTLQFRLHEARYQNNSRGR